MTRYKKPLIALLGAVMMFSMTAGVTAAYAATPDIQIYATNDPSITDIEISDADGIAKIVLLDQFGTLVYDSGDLGCVTLFSELINADASILRSIQVTDCSNPPVTFEPRGITILPPRIIVDPEGHTPGFYKNNADKKGAGSWVVSNPSDDFSDAFGLTEEVILNDKGKKTFSNPTLREALGANGGGENALARHCVAAKLNAEHPAIDYPVNDPADVIEMCRIAFTDGTEDQINDLKNQLDEWNNLGTDEVDQHWPN